MAAKIFRQYQRFAWKLFIPALFVSFMFAGEALATGLRVNGDFLFSNDTSYDVFSSKDKRSGLDLSFSYSLYYAGCAVLFDIEAGYIYFPPVEGTLFGSYSTSLLTHGAYGGARIHLRIDRKYISWLQPYIRINGGWMWAKAELSSPGDGPSMEDWGNNGMVYGGAGVQMTIPQAMMKGKRRRVCISKYFSVGVGIEVGYLWTAPFRFSMTRKDDSDGKVDPIPVEGMDLGPLDLKGLMARFSFVVTF